MSWGFEKGRLYNRRRDIHARFKGQERGGIVTPVAFPIVFIFTGLGGLDHGYSDRWRPDGAFEYFGEGQIGDMKFHKGNRAVLNHGADGKSLLLFEIFPNTIRFIDEMAYETHRIEQAPDTTGAMRDAIVFELRRLGQVVEVMQADTNNFPSELPIEELRRAAIEAAKPLAGRTTSTVTVFERSRKVRDYVLARANGKCEHCERYAPFIRANGSPYLEPHHIRRLSDGGPDDPRFVIALCPNCHREAHFGEVDELRQIHLDKMKHIEIM